jgi:hypothetical protein
MAGLLTLTRRIAALAALAVVPLALSGCALLMPVSRTVEGTTPCVAHIDRGVLPEWARTGFSDPQPAVPHVTGEAGRILGVVFGDPLTSPSSVDHQNKILWVARTFDGTSDLLISAQQMDGTTVIGQPVERIVPGAPGPSTIDLPAVGCWRLDLSWGDTTDSLDLEYIAPTT